jgi:hypothetical protein
LGRHSLTPLLHVLIEVFSNINLTQSKIDR